MLSPSALLATGSQLRRRGPTRQTDRHRQRWRRCPAPPGKALRVWAVVATTGTSRPCGRAALLSAGRSAGPAVSTRSRRPTPRATGPTQHVRPPRVHLPPDDPHPTPLAPLHPRHRHRDRCQTLQARTCRRPLRPHTRADARARKRPPGRPHIRRDRSQPANPPTRTRIHPARRSPRRTPGGPGPLHNRRARTVDAAAPATIALPAHAATALRRNATIAADIDQVDGVTPRLEMTVASRSSNAGISPP